MRAKTSFYCVLLSIFTSFFVMCDWQLTCYSQGQPKEKHVKLTWKDVYKSNDLDVYSDYLKENPNSEHLSDLRSMINRFFQERVSQAEKEGKQIIRNAQAIPGFSINIGIPGIAVSNTMLSVAGGKERSGQIELYSDPTNLLVIMSRTNEISYVRGKGIAIAGNKLYTFGF